MTAAAQDAAFTDYMSARMAYLRRLALVLCQDWHAADDLLQTTMTKTYLHWGKAANAENTDAYVRAILIREFIQERRSGWARLVSLTDRPIESTAAAADQERSLDLRAAVARLPRRQRAVLVLRYYCDLKVDQCAETLNCNPGTVKSQTAKALSALRRTIGSEYDLRPGPIPGPCEPREAGGNA